MRKIEQKLFFLSATFTLSTKQPWQ